MKKIYIIVAILIVITGNGCKKFLDKGPRDAFSDLNYWKTETEVRTFAWGYYTAYFTGYGSGNTFGKYFSGETLNDDFAPTTPTAFTKNVPASGGGWSFTWIRKSNIFVNRVEGMALDEGIKKHWLGVARFFRALEYNDLVKSFGDFPYYDKPLEETAPELYKARDPQVVVLDKMLEDFKYAAENVKSADPGTGPKGQIVNKDVVLAYMSRVFLYHGTLLKYHNINAAKSTEYLEAAKWAANEIITKGGYTLSPKYRTLFSSLDLKGNPEAILYRQYATAQNMHSLVSYMNREPQTGASKNAVEAYLCNDGLPISLSPKYKGDKTIANVLTDRDPRMNDTFVNGVRLLGIASNYSTSGYAVHKFLMEDQSLWNTPEALLNTNTTDAPIIRLGEVMVNYAEACAELGTLSQVDLNISINKLRKRNGINMPDLQISGVSPAVNGVIYDDPKRDPTVPAMIWEIRRERRIELMMEGFRNDDLKRWKKYAYLDTKANIDINRGAWIKRADFPGTSATIDGTTEGYIIPAARPETQRVFDNEKVYLSPLPLDQIKLYLDQGAVLKQNPGWL